jgi:hypothetical protein
MYRRLWCGNLKEMGHLEDLGVGGGIILKYISEEWGGRAQNTESVGLL